jgi:Aminopeptidase N
MKTGIKRNSKKIVVIMLSVAMLVVFAGFNMDDNAYAADTTGTVKVDNYNMAVQLNTEKNVLNESITVRLVNNTGNDLDRVCFRNFAASIIKQKGTSEESSTVNSIIDAGTGSKLEVKAGDDTSVVYALLGSNTFKNGDTMTLKLDCTTSVPKVNDRFGYHQNKYGKLYNLSFCFPTLSMYKNGKWNENPYFDDGESRSASCTDYHVTFKAPSDYTVAATGVESSDGNGTTEINASSIRDFAIVAGNYLKKETATSDGVTINSYYFSYNKNKNYEKLAIGSAIDSVKMFDRYFGKYPYSELDVTQASFGYNTGGMEYPGLVMIGGDDFVSAKGNPYYEETALTVAHEVGHEWFFATVGNDEYKEAWLDEGFASYCESLIYGTSGCKSQMKALKLDKVNTTVKNVRKGKAAYGYMKELNKAHAGKYYINKPVSKYSDSYSYSEHVYAGGELFIYDLKTAMGAGDFHKAVKEYYQDYYLKEATTKDFLNVITKYDNSKKVKNVINRFIDKKYL